MIAFALLFGAQAAPAPAAPLPPADWSALPVLPLLQPAGDPSTYVRAEIAAGRCRVEAGRDELAAPVAVLIGAAGEPLRLIPRAIGCPTVEQYTVGYLSTLLRTDAIAGPTAPGWYRLSVTWKW